MVAGIAAAQLNPRAPTPLYRQLADLLLKQIRSGVLEEGQRIPSEPQMAQAFAIGRPTVRQAIEQLSRQGHLERRRGSGTYVRRPRPRVDLLSLAGTSAAFAAVDIDIASHLCMAPQLRPAGTLALLGDALDPFEGRDFFVVQRLTHVPTGSDDSASEVILVEELAFDSHAFPCLNEFELEGRSLAQLTEDEFHLQPSYADQSFRVALPGGEFSAGDTGRTQLGTLMGLNPVPPLLEVRRDLYLADDRKILHARLYCRTDRFDFSQRLQAPALDQRESQS